jgi:hypothetical protein
MKGGSGARFMTREVGHIKRHYLFKETRMKNGHTHLGKASLWACVFLFLTGLAACDSVAPAPQGPQEVTVQGQVIRNVLPASKAVGVQLGAEADLSAAYVGNWKWIPSFNYTDARTRITRVTTTPSGRRINGQAQVWHSANNCVAIIARPGYSGPYYNLYERCTRLSGAGFNWYATGRNLTSVEFKICGRRNATTLVCGRSVRVNTDRP